MNTPLSERLRPERFEDIKGQEHLLGPKGFLTSTLKKGKPLSILLWGPPGCGKTSIARLYAKAFNMEFQSLSAIFGSTSDLKKIIKDQEAIPLFRRSTLLFVDEIHRFNKAQQDAFLPFIENGSLILVGATAENPSFYLNDALLSRLHVLKLEALSHTALGQILENFEKHHGQLPLEEKAKDHLLSLCQGDGRYLLNLIESLQTLELDELLSSEELCQFLQKRAPLSDKGSDQHYNLISALHKSVRGSDPNASLYWFARMLEAGQDPLFLARRMIRMASEDIGLADPQALSLALSARQAYETLGSPEGELALAQAIVYLALAPKSNRVYTAYKAAKQLASETGQLDPPAIILNAPTKMMKAMGYGKGYQYDHDLKEGFSGQNYFPKELPRTHFYEPVERGFEREMKKRLSYFSSLRAKQQPSDDLT